MDTITTMPSIFPAAQDIPTQYQINEFIEQREYLIDGELRQWQGPMNQVQSPVCIETMEGYQQKIIGSSPLLTSKESLEALTAAHKAYNKGQGFWPTLKVKERIQYMEVFVTEMQKQRDEVVKLLMWEIGKTLADSTKEFDRTVTYIQDTINALKDLDRRSSKFEIESGVIAQIRRVPLGVTLCMGPYNYPLNETFTTLIPALIMGNTVVFKPAKYGVLLIRPLLKAFCDIFPKGVINIIYGRGRDTVGALMETGQVDAFAFIGTNKGANDLKKMHPKPHKLRSVLGLDAKNPGIVLPDADMENAVAECVTGSLSYNGQRCTALKILFVHRSIVEEFLGKFTEAVNHLKPGMPWDEGVKLTPLPEPGKTDYLAGLVKDAERHGAQVVNAGYGGGEVNETYFHPAILYPVNDQMRVYREEQFGPVVPVVAYDNIEEVIAYVVSSNFGQQASIFGRDPQKIAELIDELYHQVSRININAQCQRGPDVFPFNGRKDSAEGTLSVSDALRVFSIRAIVATKDQESNKDIVRSIVKEGHSSFLRTDYIL
ncbi:NADP-dependent glyceraldehyde-3-phosphate dehydrogenase [Microscilla marina]|uniref:Aldehyde dehydrogenase n=1 Tax=Microscilla marina ATCC 23134 TaxID=313606 RepID=A1ZHM0_MICM2|nr:NADP-dependent glyceraldehyde-3-phosphate dehydrogenase [Microscilla marina]EAY30027.1 aldehyde dehydrogenase [Microscilla marina ATCC 23134]